MTIERAELEWEQGVASRCLVSDRVSRGHHDESVVSSNIDGATFCFRFLILGIVVTMANPSSPVRATNRPPLHGERTRARSWTGRAVVSCSTDSIVPKFTTIATHKTRVSEMRLRSRTNHSFDAKGSLVPVSATVERRYMGTHHAEADAP